jgi:acetyl-CoA acyltransferase
MAVLLAGLPNTVGGVTVNRFCASGITAVAMAADRIRVGEADVMIAAGAESMSMVPMMGHHPSMNMGIFEEEHRHRLRHGPDRGEGRRSAGRSREAQDAFAVESHRRRSPRSRPASSTTRSRRRHRRALPEPGHRRDRRQDAAPSAWTKARAPDSTLEGWPSCAGVRRQGQVTAGNSSQTSDGAGALILVSEKILKQFNLTPLARFVVRGARRAAGDHGHRSEGSDSGRCKAAGITQDQIDWIELNEAFAAQALAVIQDLGLDPSKVNPMGGAIALGHPLGATGAIRAATVVHALRRKQPEVRHGDDVRRHRHGRGWHHRTRVRNREQKRAASPAGDAAFFLYLESRLCVG